LSKNSKIESIAVSSDIPGKGYNWSDDGIRRAEGMKESSNQFNLIAVDYNFIDLYNMKVLNGRNFKKDFTSDSRAIIVNEEAAKLLGFENNEAAVNKGIIAPPLFGTERAELIGVIKNYHHKSLKFQFEPSIFFLSNSKKFFSIKINAQNPNETISLIKTKWDTFFPGNAFNYYFLDTSFEEQYKADQQLSKTFTAFSILAVIIASLGLFGLSSFTIANRKKEIGIRKVLGAETATILYLVSKGIVALVLVATILTMPLIYYASDQWLNDYVNRISLGWWLLVIPTVIILLITLLTISFHTVKAAMVNPINYLRSE